MELDLEWDLQLEHCSGGATRLAGLDVYYDFEWSTYFKDRRAQFRHGQCLAERVRALCPSGMRPALLLTARDDIDEGYLTTRTHFVCVLNLPNYLGASPDAYLSYLASRLGPGIAQLTHLPAHLAAASPEDFLAAIEGRLTVDHIAQWALGSQERLEQLRSLVPSDTAPAAPDLHEVVAAVEAIGGLDAQGIDAIAKLLGPALDPELRRELIHRITDDPTGRSLTQEVLGQRTTDRAADMAQVITDYKTVLANPNASETDMQRFIERSPWLLGLDYAKIWPRKQVAKGALDFWLERIDGFHDLLELKSPNDSIIRAPRDRDGEDAAWASGYSLSPDLANALAQVHVYRARLTDFQAIHTALYGLSDPRDPRLIIVIGTYARLSEYSKRVLKELNKSLHRVEVVPYDILALRGEAVLANLEKDLSLRSAGPD